MDNIKEYITKKSKELNMDIIGFTDCDSLISLKEYLEYRHINNIQVEFEEDDIEKRINPKLSLKECNSIIVVGISYNIDYKETPSYKFKGKISKSSWGLDYHGVLRERVNNLIMEIKKVRDFNYKIYVDTGPLIERELAKKAGIGYYGKNCSIINDDYGSFIFLGYILTDLIIEPNKTIVADKCGDCDLCIKACPTNALEKPYKLNAKRCISYLTQTKDEIPENLRSKMGINIYGCDTCQLVCPKNNMIKLSTHEEFIPLVTKGYIDIKEILRMSNREFRNKYGSMAGSWRGRNVLKRNAIIAIGNIKDKDSIDFLKALIEEENPLFSNYAKWSLRNML